MKCTFLLVAIVAATTVSGNAGDRIQPSGSPGGLSSVEVEEDIGEIRPAPEDGEFPRFRAAAQGEAEYTTNAKLQGDHSSSDVLWLPTLELGYNIPLGKQFSLDIMGKAESVVYSEYFDRSFYGFNGAVTFDYRHKVGWPRLSIGTEPYWYQTIEGGDQLAAAVGFLAGVDQGIPVNNGMTLLFWNARFGVYEAWPSEDSRYQYRAMAGVTHQIRPSLYGQIYYAIQFSDYHNTGRGDTRHVLGGALSYQLTANWFVNVTAGFVDNSSDEDRAEYQSFNFGIGALWQF